MRPNPDTLCRISSTRPNPDTFCTTCRDLHNLSGFGRIPENLLRRRYAAVAKALVEKSPTRCVEVVEKRNSEQQPHHPWGGTSWLFRDSFLLNSHSEQVATDQDRTAEFDAAVEEAVAKALAAKSAAKKVCDQIPKSCAGTFEKMQQHFTRTTRVTRWRWKASVLMSSRFFAG